MPENPLVTLLLELGAFAGLGFAGSLHCAGMCGPLALLARSDSQPRATATIYVVGKALGYATLGALAASALDGTSQGWLAPLRIVALLGAAALLAGTAAAQLQSIWPRVGGRLSTFAALESRAARALAPLARGARSLAGRERALVVGALNALLPCGLSWGAIALAAPSGSGHAPLAMAAFGLATAPALITSGWLLARLRGLGPRAAACVTAAAALCGSLVAARGAWSAAREQPPACCASAPEDPAGQPAERPIDPKLPPSSP